MYNLWKRLSSSEKPCISYHIPKSCFSRIDLSRFVSIIGIKWETVYPITKILKVLRIFAKVSSGVNSIVNELESFSNNSEVWIYAFVDEINAIAKNGNTAFWTNFDKCGLV